MAKRKDDIAALSKSSIARKRQEMVEVIDPGASAGHFGACMRA